MLANRRMARPTLGPTASWNGTPPRTQPSPHIPARCHGYSSQRGVKNDWDEAKKGSFVLSVV